MSERAVRGRHATMIQHVTRVIRPSDLQNCVGFYQLLGFKPVSVPAGVAGRAVWLEHRATQVHLMLSAEAQPQAGHVAVIVDRYDDTLTSLRQEGHAVEPRREHWGSPRAYVHDPAGNLVELMAWPPGDSGAAGAGLG